jgi:hypothetical protein
MGQTTALVPVPDGGVPDSVDAVAISVAVGGDVCGAPVPVPCGGLSREGGEGNQREENGRRGGDEFGGSGLGPVGGGNDGMWRGALPRGRAFGGEAGKVDNVAGERLIRRRFRGRMGDLSATHGGRVQF